MANFKQALQRTKPNEGKWCNTVGDKGGETYRGISRVFHPLWNGWTVIDSYKKSAKFPSILETDSHLQYEVDEFYKKEFWDIFRADEIISQEKAFEMFDFGVNTNPEYMVKMVQGILNVKQDGDFGNISLAALNGYNEELFINKFACLKIRHYLKLVIRDKSQERFLFNWTYRTINNIYPL